MGFTPKGGVATPASPIDEDVESSLSNAYVHAEDGALGCDAGSSGEDTDFVEDACMRQKRVEELAEVQEKSILFFERKARELRLEEQEREDAAALQVEETKVASRAQARGGAHEAMYTKSFTVAGFLDDRQARGTRFANRCQDLKEANERNNKRIVEDLEMQDSRARERLRERREVQRATSFKDAQRRAEQQKACGELRRERERVYENFYAKQFLAQATAGGDVAQALQRPASQGGSRPRKSGSGSFAGIGSPPRPSSQGGSRASRNADAMFAKDPVYQDMKKSHTLFMEELQKMSLSVAQNERRTEAYWRKLLGPDWRRLKNSNQEEDVRSSRKGSRKSSRSASAPQRDKWSLARNSHLFKDGLKKKSAAAAEDVVPESPTSGTPRMSPRKSVTSSAPGKMETTWEQRNAAAEQVREQIQERKEERWDQIEKSLSQSKLRRSNTQTALKETTSARLEDWAAKSRTCFQRKAASAVTSNAELQEKMQGFETRWAQAQHEQDVRRLQNAADRADHYQKSRSAEQALLQEQAEKIKARMDQKAETANELIKNRLEDYSAKLCGDHQEKAKHIFVQKREEEEAFRKKARNDCAVKDARTAEMLLKKKQGTLDTLRAKRKAQPTIKRITTSAAFEPSEPEDVSSIVPNETSSMTAALAGSWTASNLDDLLPRVVKRASLSRSQSLSASGTLAGTGPPPGLLTLDGLPDLHSLEAAEREDLKVPSARSNANLEHGDGEDFLEELESRSVRWLQDMRRKSSLV